MVAGAGRQRAANPFSLFLSLPFSAHGSATQQANKGELSLFVLIHAASTYAHARRWLNNATIKLAALCGGELVEQRPQTCAPSKSLYMFTQRD